MRVVTALNRTILELKSGIGALVIVIGSLS